MNLIQFKHYLYRGMGSAIIELQNNPQSDYKKIVLYACTHRTKYRGQDEPDRADYLYRALKVFKEDKWFIDEIVKALWQTKELCLTTQLVNVLLFLSKDGFKTGIAEQLQRRLDRYFKELPKEDFSEWHDGRESAEKLMIALYELFGIQSFFASIDSIAQVEESHIGDTVSFFYDHFIEQVLEDHGVNNAQVLAEQYSINDQDIITVFRKYDEENAKIKHSTKSRGNHLKYIENMPVEDFLERIEQRRFIPYAWIKAFLKNKGLNQEVLKKLALSYSVSYSQRQYAIMHIFAFIDFPFGVTDLLLCLEKAEDDSRIKDVILTALARFNDQRIRELVLQNLAKEQNILASLSLLKNNVIQEDVLLLIKILRSHQDKEHEYDFHGLMQEYLWLMKVNPSIDFGAIYQLLMNRHLCATCRSHMVELLCANDYALNQLAFIKTCVEDSHEDTSRVAVQFLENYYASLV